MSNNKKLSNDSWHIHKMEHFGAIKNNIANEELLWDGIWAGKQ